MKTTIIYLVFISTLILACKKNKNNTKNTEDTLLTTSISDPSISTNSFLSLSDVHYDSELGITKFCKSCVTGDSLWTRTKAKIEAVAKSKQPKFLVYLGDLPGYDNRTRDNNSHLMLENLRNLDIDIPILYLPGNNDSLVDDYHSFADSNGNTVLSEDATNPNEKWPILNQNSSTTKISNIDFRKEFGFYSVDVNTGGNTLKIIALNTVIFTEKSYHYNSRDNGTVGNDGVSQQQATQIQMRWLEKTLNKIDTTKVLLMMHIPLGKDSHRGKPMWNKKLKYVNINGNTLELQNAFLDEIAKHQSKITGLLNGHTHLDGLKRMYNSDFTNNNELIALSISTPGIAVNHGNNPGFKLFTYNSNTYDLLNFETYFASPTNTLKTGNFKFLKDSSYTFKQAYKVNTPYSTIFNDIKAQEENTIIEHLNSILGVKSNKNLYLHYPSSLNVYRD